MTNTGEGCCSLCSALSSATLSCDMESASALHRRGNPVLFSVVCTDYSTASVQSFLWDSSPYMEGSADLLKTWRVNWQSKPCPAAYPPHAAVCNSGSTCWQMSGFCVILGGSSEYQASFWWLSFSRNGAPTELESDCGWIPCTRWRFSSLVCSQLRGGVCFSVGVAAKVENVWNFL